VLCCTWNTAPRTTCTGLSRETRGPGVGPAPVMGRWWVLGCGRQRLITARFKTPGAQPPARSRESSRRCRLQKCSEWPSPPKPNVVANWWGSDRRHGAACREWRARAGRTWTTPGVGVRGEPESGSPPSRRLGRGGELVGGLRGSDTGIVGSRSHRLPECTGQCAVGTRCGSTAANDQIVRLRHRSKAEWEAQRRSRWIPTPSCRGAGAGAGHRRRPPASAVKQQGRKNVRIIGQAGFAAD